MTHGLRFRPVDLHVHTPASRCFRGTVTPESFVEQALATGMHAIAITDHNTGDWIDRIKEAAAGTPLTVFPGVEISVQPGIHVVAIFPEERTSAHVNDVLARLGLGADERGLQEALVTDFSAQKVVEKIKSEGALPVLAHIDDYKGAWRELSGQTLIKLWQEAPYAAVEVVGDGLPADVGQSQFTHVPAYYWSSDNPHPEDHTKHSHLGIGTRSSLFKMDETITWEGLRLCFHDPDVRIRRRDPNAPIEVQAISHPTLDRVQIQGGFLNGLDLRLNPNLNCVIGGRGTGKSTLLELLRHAFDVGAKTDANQKQAEGIIRHAFPAGSRITVEFSADNTAYRVVRNAGEEPKVYRSGVTQPINVVPERLLPLQVYGQKEIYEISQDPQFQLQLLDNYVAREIEPFQAEESALIRRLRSNASEVKHTREKIAAAEEELESLGEVKEELRRMSDRNFVSRLKDKSAFDSEERLLNRAEETKDAVLEAIQRLNEERPDSSVIEEDDFQELPHLELLKTVQEKLNRIDAGVQKAVNALNAQVAAIWDENPGLLAKWQEEHDAQEAIYQELLREFQTAGESLSPNRYMSLRNRRIELEELQDESEQDHERIKALLTERQEMLDELRQVRRRQFELRRDKAEALTEALERTVRITMHPEGIRSVYQAYLGNLFQGQNVRGTTVAELVAVQADEPEREGARPVPYRGETRHLVSRIPRYRDPIDLAAAIRAEWESDGDDESDLEQVWGVSSDAMRRNIARLDEQALFELELFGVPDRPVIELQVGNGEFGYKPLTALSVGQKCTALLGIVLLESPATLLVDQPEDDLDNQFIFDKIVNTLRREKERRQFIIATHNANIPVSGDAELIVVVEADETRGWVPEECVGSIDAEPIKQAVEQILEGGEQAFQMRKEKYGLV